MTVYVGLGGNFGDSFALLNQALIEIDQLSQIDQIEVSSFYLSSPVGCRMPQSSFINAVCRFKTELDPKTLLKKLQGIERQLGKIPKPKDAPRPIDIDILFYGSSFYKDEELEIPHPAWQSRLFVLVPLSDLTSFISLETKEKQDCFIIKDLIQKIKQSSQQHILKLDKDDSYLVNQNNFSGNLQLIC